METRWRRKVDGREVAVVPGGKRSAKGVYKQLWVKNAGANDFTRVLVDRKQFESRHELIPQTIIDHRESEAAWHRAEADAWERGERDATSAEVARIATGAASVDLGDEQSRTANGGTPTRRKAFYDAVYKASETLKTEAVDRVAMKGSGSDA